MIERATSSPLKGRYLVRNRGWNAALRVTDAVLSAVAHPDGSATAASPRRILVAVGGHLGDAVIATSVLPSLAAAFPNAAIGMLLPSWSRPVVDAHPRLRWIHHADHWKMNRGIIGAGSKWKRYRRTAGRVVKELQLVGYDVAIDLYAYYPNAAWLLWRAQIPTRIGYSSGGCGPLYTKAVEWHPSIGHTAAQHHRLIHELAGTLDVGEVRYDLPPITAEATERATSVVRGAYVVVHPGTGDRRKAWPGDRWSRLIGRLVSGGERVVITGRGDDDERIAADLHAVHPKTVNLAGGLDWMTFRAVVANASLLFGPDSVASHIAAADGVPTIAIMAAISDPEYWRPIGDEVAVLSRDVPCAPCFRKNGCATMACVRDISVDEVFEAYEGLRSKPRRYAAVGQDD